MPSPLNSPGPALEETNLTDKIFYKGLSYALVADNAGERHEVATILEATNNGLIINGLIFKLRNYSDFSRSALQPANMTQDIGTLKSQWFKDHANNFFPAIKRDSKLLFGANEIDLLVTDSTGISAFIECKSGGATSSGSQTNSYMQLCAEYANFTQKEVWFVHCHDKQTALSCSYLWSCLSGLVGSPHGRMAQKANDFFGKIATDHIQIGTFTTKSCDDFITWYNGIKLLNPGLKIGSDIDRISSMNAILRKEFSIQVFTISIQGSTRNFILGKLKSIFRDTPRYTPSSPKKFWMQVYNAL